MAAGYAFGPIMLLSPERRRAICLRAGVVATAAFVLLRAIDAYGDPRPWNHPPIAVQRAAPAAAPKTAAAPPQAQAGPPRRQMPKPLAFLNTNKYPASLLFLLMTLGPMLILLGLVDGARGPVSRVLETFGRVPFFY